MLNIWTLPSYGKLLFDRVIGRYKGRQEYAQKQPDKNNNTQTGKFIF
jgi:hypothetical protein